MSSEAECGLTPRNPNFERTRMPNIVVYTLVSLDGATENPHRYFPETGDKKGAPVFDEELARLEGGDAQPAGRRPPRPPDVRRVGAVLAHL